MFTLTGRAFWTNFLQHYRCNYCGSDAGYASRPRNFVEKYVIRVAFLRMVRCGDCYRRSCRLMTVPLRKRRDPLVVDHEAAVSTLSATVHKEPVKEITDRKGTRQRIA